MRKKFEINVVQIEWSSVIAEALPVQIVRVPISADCRLRDSLPWQGCKFTTSTGKTGVRQQIEFIV
jgi:hypothetical protein